ncbi:hypothetical protein PF003_g751 [Phytophthora fragariae]|nr:hypothetical protein PF003_g751 [Phytophthora fragariae]
MVRIYAEKTKQATIALVQAGSFIVAVAEASGPKPFLPEDAEQHIYDWVVGRQLVGRPVGRSAIIKKAREVALRCSGQSIEEGWYKRFKKRLTVGRNLERGFKACGLFLLSLVKMKARLDTFTRNGAPRHVELAAWLQLKSVVEDEILKLPAPLRKNLVKKRKRISVDGRLLTHEVLQEIEVSKRSSGVSKRGRKKRTQGSRSEENDIIESAVV